MIQLIRALTLTMVGTAISLGAAAPHAHSQEGIQACVNNSSGQLKVVPPGTECGQHETPLELNLPRFPITCPSDSVPVGSACIDTYEASVWQTSDAIVIAKIRSGVVTVGDLSGATPLGQAPGDLAAAGCPATGNGCTNVYAVSIPGVQPARYLTWFQAAAAARNSGKRIPSNAEWQAAAFGTPDPSASPGPGDCNTVGGVPVQTGSRTNCRSEVGAVDMVGNVWEFVAEWVRLGTCAGPIFPSTGDINCMWPPAEIIRGGSFDDGTGAGVFAINGVSNITSSGASLGFRGAR